MGRIQHGPFSTWAVIDEGRNPWNSPLPPGATLAPTLCYNYKATCDPSRCR